MNSSETEHRHAQIVGRTAASLLEMQFQNSGADDKPVIRVVNFTPDEVESITQGLAGVKLPGRDEPVKVVVAAAGFPPEYLGSLEPPQIRLEPGDTLTIHRNRLVTSGQVLIEIGTQPTLRPWVKPIRSATKTFSSLKPQRTPRKH